MSETSFSDRSPSGADDESAVYCMHCGTGNVGNDYACERCGERVYVPDPERPPPLGFTSCHRCASANESHASYCANCGAELDYHTRISPAGAGGLGDADSSADDDRERLWPPLTPSGTRDGRSARDRDGGRQGEKRGGGMIPGSSGRPRRSSGSRVFPTRQDDRPPIPREVRRWNWSAFILAPIWGLYHRIWWSALGLLPVLTFLPLPLQLKFVAWVLVALALGLKGNELAWRAQRWESTERFLALQQRWTTLSIVLSIGVLLLLIAFLLSG